MSRTRVAVLQIVAKRLTVTAAAAEYGISRRHLHRLLARYREGGLDALEPRSRRPHRTPIATPVVVRERVIELRSSLTAAGLDAGPVTIGWHLEQEGHTPPGAGDDQPDPDAGRADQPAAAQAPEIVLHAIRDGAAERDVGSRTSSTGSWRTEPMWRS